VLLALKYFMICIHSYSKKHKSNVFTVSVFVFRSETHLRALWLTVWVTYLHMYFMIFVLGLRKFQFDNECMILPKTLVSNLG